MKQKIKFNEEEIRDIFTRAIKAQIGEIWRERGTDIPPPLVAATEAPGEFTIDFNEAVPGNERHDEQTAREGNFGQIKGGAQKPFTARNEA